MCKDACKAEKEKEKAAKRRRRFWDAVLFVLGGWLRNKFNFTFDKSFEPADIEGPVLVAINHACAYDPLFVGAAFKNKPLTFIASEHILRSKWGPVLDKYISFIPHQKGGRGSRTALVAMKRMKKGESVFLAVEGEQTWNGRPLPVMPYTGKLIKGSGATLVTYLIEGAYLSAPRWAFSTRKGKVYGRPAGVYAPEVLREMSDAEVEKLIAKDLGFDTWEWQKSRPEGPGRYKCGKGGNAEGLERSVFTCPACGAFGTLRSKGDSIGCSCGLKIRMDDTGFFDPKEPFETVADWEEFDRTKLAERLKEMGRAAGEDTVFTDGEVVLHRIGDGHSDEEAARGLLTLSHSGESFMLKIGDCSFDLRNISNMTMVLANRIVFSDETGYYELLSNKKSRTNLRKYVIARELLTKE
ncbi:MAG: 1-acyl-sn-glycerol-3-phosphate acyltransferase [Mogibacterium sp.]|nr:1-acyl-sn-glycerol-3-phosphate acyltransferase [Mogibacterium sp.]